MNSFTAVPRDGGPFTLWDLKFQAGASGAVQTDFVLLEDVAKKLKLSLVDMLQQYSKLVAKGVHTNVAQVAWPVLSTNGVMPIGLPTLISVIKEKKPTDQLYVTLDWANEVLKQLQARSS